MTNQYIVLVIFCHFYVDALILNKFIKIRKRDKSSICSITTLLCDFHFYSLPVVIVLLQQVISMKHEILVIVLYVFFKGFLFLFEKKIKQTILHLKKKI